MKVFSKNIKFGKTDKFGNLLTKVAKFKYVNIS
jgi:hypothetical protein